MTRQNRQKPAITRRQALAIMALLSHPTLAAAAESCGVAERTLQHYLAMPHFRLALVQAESVAIADAARRLAADAAAAAQVLSNIMKDEGQPGHTRVTAAKAWLTLTPIFREHSTLEMRLTELEGKFYENDPKTP